MTAQDFVNQYSGYIGAGILLYLAWQYRGAASSAAGWIRSLVSKATPDASFDTALVNCDALIAYGKEVGDPELIALATRAARRVVDKAYPLEGQA